MAEDLPEHDDAWYIARIDEVIRTFNLGGRMLDAIKCYPLKTQLRALENARAIATRAATKQMPFHTH